MSDSFRNRRQVAWSRSCLLILVLTLDIKANPLTDSLANRLLGNRYLGKIRQVSLSELSGIIGRILDDSDKWNQGRADKLLDCRDFLVNVCFSLSIPVVEMAYALYVLRDELSARISEPKDLTNFFERLAVELTRRY